MTEEEGAAGTVSIVALLPGCERRLVDDLTHVGSDWWQPGAVLETVRSQLAVAAAIVRPAAVGDPVVEVELLEEPSGSFPTAPYERAGSLLEHPIDWYRPGWLQQATEDLDACLTQLGRRRTAPVVQEKHWNISAILRVPTDGGALWAKWVVPMFAHEGPVVRAIAETLGGVVPEVVHVDDGWWLAEPFAEIDVPQDLPADQRRILVDEVLDAHAALQRRAGGEGGGLLDLGAPDRRDVGGRFEELIAHDLVTHPRVVVGLGATEHGPDLLSKAHQAVEVAVGRLQAAGLGSGLAHGDLHLGNVGRSREGSLLTFDWTDVCVAPPTVDILSPLMRLEGPEKRVAARRYLATLLDVAVDDVDPGLVGASMLASAAFLADSYRRIHDGLPADEGIGWLSSMGSWLSWLLENVEVASGT